MNRINILFFSFIFLLLNLTGVVYGQEVREGTYVDKYKYSYPDPYQFFDIIYPDCLIKKDTGFVSFPSQDMLLREEIFNWKEGYIAYPFPEANNILYRLGNSPDEEYTVIICGPYSMLNWLGAPTKLPLTEASNHTRRYIKTAFDHTIKFYLSYMLNKDIDRISRQEVEEHVTIKSSEYAKNAYNADSIAVMDYCLPKEDNNLWGQGGKYTGGQLIIFQKQDQVDLPVIVDYGAIICLYTDKGKKGIDAYMKCLEGLIRFKDRLPGCEEF